MIKVLRSFGYAWQGIRYCLKTQLNFRVHLVVLMFACGTGWLLKISSSEWLFVIACAMLVLVLEMINTAIEYLCDSITTDFNAAIKIIKDVSAGAVLVAATGSVLTGTIIFLPKIILLLNK